MRVKNKKLLTIFFLVLYILTAYAINLTRSNFRVFADTTPSSLSVYKDNLESGFANWSWNSQIDLQNKSQVKDGSTSISFTPNSYGGLYLHTDTDIDLNKYDKLHFYLYPTGQLKLNVIIYGQNNEEKTNFPLSNYLPNPSVNSWNEVSIPASDLQKSASIIKGFSLMDATGSTQPVIYIDNIEFTPQSGATPTPTPDPTLTPTPTPTPTNLQQPAEKASDTQNNSITVYKDKLENGFANWSWDSTINFANTYPVNEGSNSISFTANAAWGGLYLHTDSAIDTTQSNTLSFSAKASNDQQKYALLLYDENNQLMHEPIAFDSIGGQPVSSVWKDYSVQLTAYTGNKKLKGFGINDLTGHSQPALYIDFIQFKNSSSINTDQTASNAAGTNATSPTPTIATSPTPTPLSGAPTPIPTPLSGAPAPVSQNTGTVQISGNPFSGATIYNNQDSNPALRQAEEWNSSRPADAAAMKKIADQPKAMWMGGWSGDIHSAVQNIVDKASKDNAMPIFIAYNVPFRDCGSFSAGGSANAQAYRDWIKNFADGIGNRKATVVLEPDALAGYTCLPDAGRQERVDLLKNAIETFKSHVNTLVYLDGGHSGWVEAGEMAKRLKSAGLDEADGFSVNVSNFDSTETSIAYGQQISSQTGGKHFIIDTSRNGNGPAGSEWCNPAGRALGVKPTFQTGNSSVDGFLWLKYPGESDGACNGGPSAGTWYPDYALGLAQRAQW